jgi:uncharacterized protein DUF4296
MTRIFFIAFSLFLITACKKQDKKNILPPQKMKLVLWDLSRADELAEHKMLKDSSFRGLEKHVALYKEVFAIHHITKSDFQKSLQYYESNPEIFKGVLDSMQAMAERIQAQSEGATYMNVPTPQKIDSNLKRPGRLMDSMRKKRPPLPPRSTP